MFSGFHCPFLTYQCSVDELTSIVLPSGTEITDEADTEALLPGYATLGCVFDSGNPGLGLSEHDGGYLFPARLGVGFEEATTGQSVVFVIP